MTVGGITMEFRSTDLVTTESTNHGLVALSVVLTAFFFVIDLELTLGVAAGILYIAVILIALWSPNRNYAIYSAVICSILVLIGFHLSPQGGELWKVLLNRSLSLFAIWITAILVTMWKISDEKVFNARCEIEKEKEDKYLTHEKEIIATKEEAEHANNAKSEFLARMSHELRTPLNAILGFGQLLMIDNENLTNDQKEGVDYILKGGDHLLNLINEILDIAKVDAGEMNLTLTDISLDSIIRSSLLLTRPLALKRGIKIQEPSATHIWLRTDIQRIKQVLVNLISNAIKYNHKGGDVRINVSLVLEGYVRISVIDNGFGISEKSKEELFEPFHRLSKNKENIEGTGIGLTITKKLVELMNGRIGVESELDKGSTFWVEFPQANSIEVKKEEYKYQSAPIDHSAGLKIILYIEDNQTNLMLVKRALEQSSCCKLISATNAEEGIPIAREQQPDLILMDIDLPGMNGFEALDILQADEQTAHIPVIAVSALAMKEQVEKGNSAKFSTYLTKPIKVDRLLEAVCGSSGAYKH